MASLGLAPGLIIGLREGIEAALIVGLIAAYLIKTDRRHLVRFVILGLIAAIIASIVVAGVLVSLSLSLDGVAEELFEGFSAILAVVVLTFMIFWMMMASKDVRGHFENRVDALTGKQELFGLMGLAFIAVFREGVETALFMLGLASAVTTGDAVLGVSIGILAAALIGLSLPRISRRIPVRRFFRISSIILVAMAAGLFATGVHELQEASEMQLGSGQVYNLQGVFSSREDNPTGYLLHGIFGYSDSPTHLQTLAYFGYLAVVLVIWWIIITKQVDQAEKKDDTGNVKREPTIYESSIPGEPSIQPSVDINRTRAPIER